MGCPGWMLEAADFLWAASVANDSATGDLFRACGKVNKKSSLEQKNWLSNKKVRF
jgi:hypothetical protein